MSALGSPAKNVIDFPVMFDGDNPLGPDFSVVPGRKPQVPRSEHNSIAIAGDATVSASPEVYLYRHRQRHTRIGIFDTMSSVCV